MYDAPLLYVTHFYFSLGRSNWSSPPFSSTAFQKCHSMSDLPCQVPKLQYHIKLRAMCSILLVSSLYLSPICRWKEPSSCWILLFTKAIQHLISGVHLASFIMLPKYLKYSTFSVVFDLLVTVTVVVIKTNSFCRIIYSFQLKKETDTFSETVRCFLA